VGCLTLRSSIYARLPVGFKTRRWVNYELKTGEPELRLVRSLLGASGILIDVGANAGIYSALAIRYGRRVVAFEPVPEEAAALRKLIGSRGVVNEVALSDHMGTAVLHIPFQDGRDLTTRSSLEDGLDEEFAHRAVSVAVATLDSFELSDVALVKIDVEGHEVAVLRGSAETLNRARPNVLVEVEELRSPGSVATVSSILRSYGYEGHWLHNGELRSIDQFDPVVQQAHPPKPGEALNGYVNNLLWSPIERPLKDVAVLA
jgi:FkbM family methyltransferase